MILKLNKIFLIFNQNLLFVGITNSNIILLIICFILDLLDFLKMVFTRSKRIHANGRLTLAVDHSGTDKKKVLNKFLVFC
jgi:hypothetical protein